MRSVALVLSTLALACAASGSAAQVHRCGESSLYTDKPCRGARAVDLRPNILDAGPRQMPVDPPPAPAVIPPTAYDPPRMAASSSSGSIWDTRDARDAESRSRTTGYRP
jgi:hypothetical protein